MNSTKHDAPSRGGSGLSEGLGHLATAYRELNIAYCGATLAMQEFADAGRRYVVWRGRRRLPAQLRMRGARGRARVLKGQQNSLGFEWLGGW